MALTVKLEDFSKINFELYFMPMLTIYDNPKDFPDKFVARIFDIVQGTPVAQPYALVADSLEEIHDKIPDRFFNLPLGQEEDDPAIIELWI